MRFVQMKLYPLLLATTLYITPYLARAETTQEILRNFGLEGHLAANCSSKPDYGPDKVHFHFILSEHAPIMVSIDLGDGNPLAYAVIFATNYAGNKVIVTGIAITDLYVARTVTVYEKKGSKIRMVEGSISGVANKTSKSVYGDLVYGQEFNSITINDGKMYFMDQKPMDLPWLEKCPN